MVELDRTDLARVLSDNSPDGVIAVDTEAHCLVWNRRREEISCLSRERVLGKRVPDVFPGYSLIVQDRLCRAALAGKTVSDRARPFANPGTGALGYF